MLLWLVLCRSLQVDDPWMCPVSKDIFLAGRCVKSWRDGLTDSEASRRQPSWMTRTGCQHNEKILMFIDNYFVQLGLMLNRKYECKFYYCCNLEINCVTAYCKFYVNEIMVKVAVRGRVGCLPVIVSWKRAVDVGKIQRTGKKDFYCIFCDYEFISATGRPFDCCYMFCKLFIFI